MLALLLGLERRVPCLERAEDEGRGGPGGGAEGLDARRDDRLRVVLQVLPALIDKARQLDRNLLIVRMSQLILKVITYRGLANRGKREGSLFLRFVGLRALSFLRLRRLGELDERPRGQCHHEDVLTAHRRRRMQALIVSEDE